MTVRKTAAVAAIVLATFTASFAADKASSWYVGIEGSSLKAGQDEAVLGTPLDPDTFGPGGDLITLDLGSGTAYALKFGYKNDKSDCWVSYWSYDEDTTTTREDAVNGFLTGFGNADFGDDFANRLDGTQSLKSDSIDIVWARPFATGDKSSWNWQLGFRSWNLENEVTRTDDFVPASGLYDTQLHNRSDASGLGLTAGVGANYHITPKIWGSSTLRFGLLTGSVDVDYDFDSFGDVLTSGIDGADRNFMQVEFDARLNMNFVAGLDGFIGYQFKSFGNAATTMEYVDDVQEGLVATETDDVTFGGFVLGLSYRF
jgi:hypothetical protein